MDVTVFLVDDHEIVRRGVRTLIDNESDLTVIGEASTVVEALAQIPEAGPRVALLDLHLPDGTGVELCRAVREQCPDIACLILTSYEDDGAIVEATAAGAAGYLLKQIRGGEILSAIRAAAQGQTVLDAARASGGHRAPRRDQGEAELDARAESLSPQERRILDHLATGASNREIADELGLAEKTVKNYVSGLLSKMGMTRRTEAAVYAVRLAERRRG
ncbi:MAG: response regulator transcription factor [Microthrixaceae bacterium]|nr:response regulator transcription factor [Microthrixaceae bacterium]MCO5313674.1 response regulator transcription factor [Microthrixaceae bacterium]HPB45035.1 response regulator transcription factor [Microthrixaceae bacterium]